MATFDEVNRALGGIVVDGPNPMEPAAVCKVRLTKVEKEWQQRWYWHPGKEEEGPRGSHYGDSAWGAYRDVNYYTLHFTAVMGGGENKRFWEASPNASFTFGTINEEAALRFKPGHEYYVPFVHATSSGPEPTPTV